MVDCGVRYSGPSAAHSAPWPKRPSTPLRLLSHAHMDHAGGLPVLAEACPGAPVLATPPTIDLVAILLNDAVRLMNGPERESELPLYNERQVERLLAAFRPVKYHQTMRIKDVEVSWLPASHILGAAMILLRLGLGHGAVHWRLQRLGPAHRARIGASRFPGRPGHYRGHLR